MGCVRGEDVTRAYVQLAYDPSPRASAKKVKDDGHYLPAISTGMGSHQYRQLSVIAGLPKCGTRREAIRSAREWMVREGMAT